GLSPIAVDLSEFFGQADYDPPYALEPMPEARRGTLILHANAPETERALFKLGMFRPKQWRTIGCWAWELEAAPASWAAAQRHLSEVWALSSFVENAFQQKLSIPVKTVRPLVSPPPVSADRQRFNIPGRAIACLTMADGRSSFERKNTAG